MLEIEKTYLVRKLPDNLSSYQSDHIKQGYISSTTSPLRIRKKGQKLELTKKMPLKADDFSSAQELTILLTEEEFNKLWPLTEKFLEKSRYYIPLEDNLTAELDIFQGKLAGLVLVEVEFKSAEQMESFKPPDWFGKDVTQEAFSANVYLAGKTLKGIQAYLE